MKPLFTKLDCVSLYVPNIEDAIEFYSVRLGHEIIWQNESGAGLRLPDSNVELVLHVENRPNEVDWKVDSVPDAISQIVGAGGQLVTGPFEIQIGSCAVLQDPWKNQIVILDSSKLPTSKY